MGEFQAKGLQRMGRPIVKPLKLPGIKKSGVHIEIVSHYSLSRVVSVLSQTDPAWYTYTVRETEIVRDFREKNGGRTALLEHEVKGMLGKMGLAVPKGRFLRRGEDLPEQLDLTFPLVAKVSSSTIISKTNVGGVRVNIKNADELNSAFRELSAIESAEGVLVEEMAPQGLEVIIGGIVDSQFGPVVMFGLGGIFVELFEDVAFGLAPLTTNDALWLIAQVKGARLLEGYRGKPSIDKQLLARMIVSVSEVMATDVVAEIDLNPVTLYPQGAMILDAKMQLLS